MFQLFTDNGITHADDMSGIIVKNTHEPLIDEYTFEQAQKATIIKRRTNTGKPHMFAGLLKCADCGNNMHHLIRTGRSYSASYSCYTFSRYGKQYCSMHYIRKEDVCEVVLNDIRRYAEMAKNHEKELVESLCKEGSDNAKKQLVRYRKDIAKAEKRLSEISVIIKRLYEDSVTGKLTDERFCEMSKGYEAEAEELKARVSEMENAITSYKEASYNSQQFVEMIKGYFDIKELNSAMLNEILEKVVVHEREVIGGERHQRIDIYYNFVGMVGENRHMFYDGRYSGYKNKVRDEKGRFVN